MDKPLSDFRQEVLILVTSILKDSRHGKFSVITDKNSTLYTIYNDLVARCTILIEVIYSPETREFSIKMKFQYANESLKYTLDQKLTDLVLKYNNRKDREVSVHAIDSYWS